MNGDNTIVTAEWGRESRWTPANRKAFLARPKAEQERQRRTWSQITAEQFDYGVNAPEVEIIEAQKPPVGSVSVLVSEESDRATGKTNTILGTLNHVGKHVPVSLGIDDDFDDEPLPARTCAIDNPDCERCQ